MDAEHSTLADPNLIADHALIRMGIEGPRSTVVPQLRPVLGQVARRLIAGDEDRRDLLTALRAEGYPLRQSAWYRFAQAFERAAKAVHSEMIAGAGLPAMATPAEAAKALKLTEAEVLTAIDAGELAAVELAGQVRIPVADLRSSIVTLAGKRRRRDKCGRFIRANPSAEGAPSVTRLTPSKRPSLAISVT